MYIYKFMVLKLFVHVSYPIPTAFDQFPSKR